MERRVEASEKWKAANMERTGSETGSVQQWRNAMEMWAGVMAIPNKEWEVPREVDNMDSHSPSPPSTPPPSPLTDLEDLPSLWSISSSTSSSSLLFQQQIQCW